MTSLADVTIPPAGRGCLRPVQASRDLLAVADLVELCFKDSLDQEGRSYLKQMRQAAQENEIWHWAATAAEAVNGLPISGYVWEEKGVIVGNLSLIPLRSQGQRMYLIANVAVHPEHRGRGIGRMLTATALEYVQRRGIRSAWLQVRHDNPPAIHIYQSLGFREQARRTTWNSPPGAGSPAEAVLPPGERLTQRSAAHWALQSRWLERLYPSALRWHLPLNLGLLKPGLWGSLQRFFSLEYPTHWTYEKEQALQGVLSSHSEAGHNDTLWLAAPPEGELDETAIQALLATARRQSNPRRAFTLNLPAGYAQGAVQAAGFQSVQTLIWMRSDFR